MFHSAVKSIVATIGLSLLGLTLFIGLMVTGAGTLRAVAPLYVDDDTCPAAGSGTTGDPYCAIQSAVDAAVNLAEIRVAGGTYTGTQTVEAQDGWEYTQVVLIDRKSITVKGGYDGANWGATPDPLAFPSVIDAERSGRGITALGTSSQEVTLDGLTVTGGDYTGLGNAGGVANNSCLGRGYDCGGGMRVKNLKLIMRNMIVYDNIAGRTGQDRSSQGGGLDLHFLEAGSMILNSKIISNTASGVFGYGGGLYVYDGELSINNSLIEQNMASNSGGGLMITYAEALVSSGTSFNNNSAASTGGAIFDQQAYCSSKNRSLLVKDGYLTENQALAGAAIYLSHPNGSTGDCGATLTNLIMADNSSGNNNIDEALIMVRNRDDTFTLLMNHITAADNKVPTFLHLMGDSGSQAITTTVNNTLVVSTTYGIAANEEAGELVIDVNNPLMYEVNDHYSVVAGTPFFDVLDPVSGDPKLAVDYHLLLGSAAIDAGTDVGILVDIDGDPRSDSFPDIGADELPGSIYLPTVLK